MRAYTERTATHWPAAWGDIEALRADLARHVGHGAVKFLQSLAGDKRVVAKTPSVRNLHLAPGLFPRAQLVLLVLDGRSVAESYVKGFSWSYERAMQTWARGADTILAFTSAKTPDADQLRRINEVIDRLVTQHGYCTVCANELLTYVGTLLAR